MFWETDHLNEPTALPKVSDSREQFYQPLSVIFLRPAQRHAKWASQVRILAVANGALKKSSVRIARSGRVAARLKYFLKKIGHHSLGRWSQGNLQITQGWPTLLRLFDAPLPASYIQKRHFDRKGCGQQQSFTTRRGGGAQFEREQGYGFELTD